MNKDLEVCISNSNIKMGEIRSVSLPPIKCCRKDAPCCKLCYALRMTKRRKNVRDSYERNLNILNTRPDIFWKSVDLAMAPVTVFRFMVSGDIPTREFIDKEMEIIRANPHCQVIQFTKRYEWINDYLHDHELPENLHLIFSAWKGLEFENPYQIPECHVIYKDGTTTAHDGPSYLCSGNCFECFRNCKNCFNLKKGEQILLKQH